MYPILFKIGNFELRAYGLMIALAFITATLLGAKEAKRRGFDPNLIFDFLFYAMIFGILGARIYYVIFADLNWFLKNPFEIIAIWKGGISLHGGLIGGILTAIWFCKKKKILFWQFADLMAPSMIIGQAVGRLACTFNGCSYGRPTDVPWAIMFTNPDAMAPLNIPLHPTQFYELFTDLLIFLFIWILRKRTVVDGQLFLIYGMLYAIARFIIEYFRGDSLLIAGLLPVPQAISIIIFITSFILYMMRITRKKRLENKIDIRSH